jgi:histidinol-phosphate aminotransferase
MLEAYKAGKPIAEVQKEFGLSRVIKLASNENPLGPSPKAIEEMKKVLMGLHYYPNGGLDLREILAERFTLQTRNVICGSGSESILATIVRTFFCDDDEAITTEAPFIGFRVLINSRGIKTTYVPYKDYRYDLPAIADAINEKTKLIYLANPNNPTGTFFTQREFEEFYTHVSERVLIILDEAYFEYARFYPHYPDSMKYRYDNVITLRTFSKCYGLAGVRIGYGFAHEELIANLMKVKLPFEPSSLAQAAAIGALNDEEFLLRTLEVNENGLLYLQSALVALGVRVVPSVANFLLLEFETISAANMICMNLLQRGVIVRPLSAFGLPHCIRVSTGTMEENMIFIETLESILKNKLHETVEDI